MNKIKTLITSLTLAVGLFAPLALTSPAFAAACSAGASPKECITSGTDTTTTGAPTLQENLKTITTVLLWTVGVIAVIVIVIAGIRYTTSGGDSNAIKGARDSILYAVVGIVVAILAYAIVNFVVGNFS